MRPAHLLMHYPVLKAAVDDCSRVAGPDGIILNDAYARVFDSRSVWARDLRNSFNDKLGELHHSDRANYVSQLYDLVEETLRVGLLKKFGRQIFRLEAAITEELENTNLGDVRAGDIRLPYPHIYVSYKTPIAFGRSGRIEGFYAGRDQKGITIALCLIPGEEEPQWSLGSTVAVGLHEPDVELTEAVETQIAETTRAAQVIRREMSDARTRAESELDVRILDRTTQETVLVDLSENREAIREALRFVGKVLCLLTAMPEGAVGPKVWSETGEHFDRKKAKPHFERGELPVRIVTIPSTVNHHSGAHPDGDRVSPRAHWRRGHYRRQRAGLGNTETRIIWIRPVFVNPEAGPVAAESVYEVRP